MDDNKMTEAELHIQNAEVILEEGGERGFVNDTLAGLLAEIERLESQVYDLTTEQTIWQDTNTTLQLRLHRLEKDLEK